MLCLPVFFFFFLHAYSNDTFILNLKNKFCKSVFNAALCQLWLSKITFHIHYLLTYTNDLSTINAFTLLVLRQQMGKMIHFILDMATFECHYWWKIIFVILLLCWPVISFSKAISYPDTKSALTMERTELRNCDASVV